MGEFYPQGIVHVLTSDACDLLEFEPGERGHGMLLEIEELHLLDAAGQGRRDLRCQLAGALARAISLGEQFRHLGMDQRRRGRGGETAVTGPDAVS